MTSKYEPYLRTYKIRNVQFKLAVTGYSKEPNRFYKVVRQLPNLVSLINALEELDQTDERIALILLNIIRAEPTKDESKSDVFERILKQLEAELVEYSPKEIENQKVPPEPLKEYYSLDFSDIKFPDAK